jgi:hypothetical protein
MWRILALASLAAGCGASLGDGPDQHQNSDANGSSDGSGSNGGRMDAGVDAPPACANGRVVYLNFDGVTITQGSPSDATANRTNWLTNASAAVPPYHQGSGTRATDITSIIDGTKLRLQGTPIQVVTSRPATGKYVMIVFGGTRAADGGTVGTQYTYATNEHDCGDLVKNDLGWVSDVPAVSYVPDLVMGAIGWGVGLNGTNAPTDCMCAWANGCTEDPNAACTLSASIASTTSSGNTTCANQNPQNEVAAFSTGFCQ